MENKKTISAKDILQKLGTVMALAILCLIFSFALPGKFPTINNIMNILRQASINCLIAAGMLCALITAGIDLSVGSNCVLCTCTIGFMVQKANNMLQEAQAIIEAGGDLAVAEKLMTGANILLNPILLVLAGLAVSTFCGFINGTLLTRLELPHPFVSTMGMKNVLLGIALLITGGQSIGFTAKGVDGLMALGNGSFFKIASNGLKEKLLFIVPEAFIPESIVESVRNATVPGTSGPLIINLGNIKADFSGFPLSFLLVILVFIIFDIFLRRTALGRQIYCCGGNPEAARLSGIPSKNVLTFVYALSGFMSGMAGVICVGRLASANATGGATYDNDAIAACIVGGASFTGGKGTIWGTLIGALLMAVINNGLNLMGAQKDIQYIVIGGVIILAVTLDVFRNKMEAKARKMAAK